MSKKLNPKLVISQYFDSIIQRIDIFTEEQLEKCSQTDSLTIPNSMDYTVKTISENRAKTTTEGNESPDELDFENDDNVWKHDYENIWNGLFNEKFEKINIFRNVSIPENEITVNMRDYLNQARDEMLAELAKAQEEAFKHYEMIKKDIKRDKDEDEDKLMEKLFANKFYILVEFVSSNDKRLKQNSQHLILIDFYLNKPGRDLFR